MHAKRKLVSVRTLYRIFEVKRGVVERRLKKVDTALYYLGNGNFLRRLALPRKVKHWSLTTLREKLIKIGAKIVHHARYVFFQMAEVAVPQKLFAAILERIARLRVLPDSG